ncbi:MAG: nicotinate (nicotinamide) nucleotide adenylyltransferase, partial [Eggerthellaceae bacterium]|nr:nicotinate (nicotinamide) nucleotide adenylyltransferase [Eggerthellaceae bacterium]
MADGSKRIAIFGGTFNPPHEGHVACVRIALAEFGDVIDRVLVMPSAAAYYKGAADVPALARLEMCKAAFAGMEGVEVSDLDIRRGGTTFTVDTLADVKAAYPEAGRPIFILGTDSYASLPKWKDADVLAREATFLVIPREDARTDGYWGIGEDACTARSAHPGFDTLFARETAPMVSSTELRERLARGESAIERIPEAVLCYIRRLNLYGSAEHMKTDVNVFSGEFLEARRQELLARVGEHRYAHIIGVAETAKSLAKAYGVDEDKAYLAGLLHDWDKAYDDEGIRARADELGLAIREDVYWGSPQTLHG